jgi:ABC-type transport system involved in multi-copper enzyme maturation permease subunit
MLNNPVLKIESRTRWRGARAFLLMLAYAVILASAMIWRYGTAMPAFEYSTSISQTGARASSVGRELFLTLSTLQMIGWMILAPALTATGLAGERERGLLEGVQLSRLSPVQILWGKMLSALSFIILMMPVALPITATCFFLGGMAPQELAIMTLLQLVTAANGASIGLFFSARSRRAQGALASAFIVTAMWGWPVIWLSRNGKAARLVWDLPPHGRDGYGHWARDFWVGPVRSLPQLMSSILMHRAG